MDQTNFQLQSKTTKAGYVFSSPNQTRQYFEFIGMEVKPKLL